jgi:hypothetical protein
MRRKNVIYLTVAVILLALLGGLVYVYLTLNRPKEAEAFSGPGFKFVRAIYGFGANADEFFKGPFGLAWANNELYITDNQVGGVYAFNEEGEFLRQIGKNGRGPGEYVTPLGVAVGPQGQVIVADRTHAKAVVYAADGTFLEEIKAEMPLVPYFAPGGLLYVTVGAGIDVFDPGSYEKLDEWGERGPGDADYDFPNGIALASDGNLIISDGNNMRVKSVSLDGEVNWLLGEPPADMNDASRLWGLPGGLTIVDGVIYMADPLNGVIHLISEDGTYLAEVGDPGEQEGSFEYPSQIVHLGGSRFAISEWGNARVSIVEINAEAAIEAWQEAGNNTPGAKARPAGDDEPATGGEGAESGAATGDSQVGTDPADAATTTTAPAQ